MGGGRGYRSDFDRPQFSQQRDPGEGNYTGGTSPGSSYRMDSMFNFGGGGSYGGSMGSNSGSDQWNTRGQHAGRGPKGYLRSDERIEEDVNEALAQHPEIDASEIEVKVSNGEVTLAGTVTERQFKRMAEDITERCSGVQDVRNEIRVQRETESGNGSQMNQQTKGKTVSGSGAKPQEAKTA